MAQSGKYGYIAPGDIEGKIGPEEPVFILRAQDALSVMMLTEYLTIGVAFGCDTEFMDAVSEIRDGFVEWQKSHGIKIPD